jgi:4-amino-4-deoxy-L-arabinose transferase-like glycosyltransferase
MARRAISTPRLYRLFVCSVLLALTVPRMTQRGMFGDGIVYATIARNMSIGVGSLWAPTYTATTDTEDYEHPPLGFALEAIAFRVLGDHPAVERVYSLLMFGLTALLIAAIWRRLQLAEYDWLPLLFWILPSIVTWAVVNNMLENTQTLFTTAAVLFLLVGWRARTAAAAAWWSVAAGAAVVAATLTKGPVGLYPLVVPLVLRVVGIEGPIGSPTARRTWFVQMTVTLLAVVAASGVLLIAYEPSRHALTEYLHTQLIPSLQGKREVNADPLATLRHLGLGIAARMVVVCGLLWAIGRRGPVSQRLAPAAVFLTMALCASVPIGVSPKLVGHYFLPSVPLFALGFASLAIQPASSLMRAEPGWHRRVPAALASVLLVASAIVPVVHGAYEPRDRDLIPSLDAVAAAMPRGVVIGTCRESMADWRLHSYVNRFFGVSLQPESRPVNGWFLQQTGACQPPPGCSLAARGDTLALFRCQFSSLEHDPPVRGERGTVPSPFAILHQSPDFVDARRGPRIQVLRGDHEISLGRLGAEDEDALALSQVRCD